MIKSGLIMEYAVEVSRVSKSFQELPVLTDVSLNIPQGSVYGFLGNNGAGKSTLIRILMGLLSADSGSVKINGATVDCEAVNYRQNVGCIVDSPCLYPHLTPRDYLRITCKLKGLHQKVIDEAMAIVNMTMFLDKPIQHFSLGMKQRLAIANAIIGSPKLLILDEPTNGLDPAGMQEIRELLKSLPSQLETTVLLSSHLLDEIEKTATHVAIMHKGKIQLQSELAPLLAVDEGVLEVKTSSANQLRDFLLQQNITSEVITEQQLRIMHLNPTACGDLNRTIVNANFDLFESRFNQTSLEHLFFHHVNPVISE